MKEKERDELWKRLEELELTHKQQRQQSAPHNSNIQTMANDNSLSLPLASTLSTYTSTTTTNNQITSIKSPIFSSTSLPYSASSLLATTSSPTTSNNNNSSSSNPLNSSATLSNSNSSHMQAA